MKAQALSNFRTKLRLSDKKAVLVNAGETITGDEDLLRALARTRMVVLIEEPPPPVRTKSKRKRKK